MPDLCVVQPGGGNVIYQDLDAAGLTGIEPPAWARMVAGYCRDRGHSVVIHDAQIPGQTLPLAGLHAIILHGHQPNASAQSMDDAIRICGEIRAAQPDALIIAVGGVAASMPEKVKADTGADYVCTGEGPVTVDEVLRGVHHPAGLLGEKPAPLADMDDLHGDTWDLLPDLTNYRAHNWQCFDGSPRSPYGAIITSLGCPFKCNFCCINAPFGGPGYRCRKPADVVEEISRLHYGHNVTTFRIIDEMFVLKPSHYIPICEALAAKPYAADLNIWAYARVDTIREDDLALLRRAGIRWLCLGIESGSAHVRDGAHKAIDGNGIIDAVKAIQAADISVLGNFMFGLPDDTHRSMTDTFRLAEAVECEYANFYAAQAYPGSALFAQADPADLPDDWAGYSQHSYTTKPLRNAQVGAKDILWVRDQAFLSFYTNPAYIDRIGRKFGDHAVAEVEKMVAVKIKRKLLEAA